MARAPRTSASPYRQFIEGAALDDGDRCEIGIEHYGVVAARMCAEFPTRDYEYGIAVKRDLEDMIMAVSLELPNVTEIVKDLYSGEERTKTRIVFNIDIDHFEEFTQQIAAFGRRVGRMGLLDSSLEKPQLGTDASEGTTEKGAS
jgi:hypothetical protein